MVTFSLLTYFSSTTWQEIITFTGMAVRMNNWLPIYDTHPKNHYLSFTTPDCSGFRTGYLSNHQIINRRRSDLAYCFSFSFQTFRGKIHLQGNLGLPYLAGVSDRHHYTLHPYSGRKNVATCRTYYLYSHLHPLLRAYFQIHSSITPVPALFSGKHLQLCQHYIRIFPVLKCLWPQDVSGLQNLAADRSYSGQLTLTLHPDVLGQ